MVNLDYHRDRFVGAKFIVGYSVAAVADFHIQRCLPHSHADAYDQSHANRIAMDLFLFVANVVFS